MTGASEATAIEAIGKAEAERMRQKAAAYKMYGDAAMTALVLEALPKVKLNLVSALINITQVALTSTLLKVMRTKLTASLLSERADL